MNNSLIRIKFVAINVKTKTFSLTLQRKLQQPPSPGRAQETMKTKKLFAVLIFDNTCNVVGKDFGFYGKGDYSWITDSLNGGNGGDYSMTEEEANEVKADFEQIIRERNLEWASVDVDFMEWPIAETMQDIADFYNESDVIDDPALDSMIKANGWVSDIGTEDGVCHSDTEKVIINENGEAIVVNV